jgi:hypothetical protein
MSHQETVGQVKISQYGVKYYLVLLAEVNACKVHIEKVE